MCNKGYVWTDTIIDTIAAARGKKRKNTARTQIIYNAQKNNIDK